MVQQTAGNAARRTALALAGLVCLAPVACKKTAATVDDATVTAGVQGKIQADSALSSEPIQVSTQGGVVMLNGQVSNGAARTLAANDAASVTGVREVVNNLAVVPGTPPVSATATTPQPEVATQPIQRSRAHVEPRAVQQGPAPVQRSGYDNQQQQAYTPPPPPRDQAPPPPAFRNVTVPAGTSIPVRITQTLDSETAHVGDTFSGAVAADVLQDGVVVLPRGTGVSGSVVNAKDATHFSGSSLLAIQLTGINRRGQQIAVTTDTFSKQGAGRGKNTAVKTGVGAGAGAILGGIFGGGKGAAIGAAAGGGTGAGINAVTRGQQVQIPSETVVPFTLANSITVRTSTGAGEPNGAYGNHGYGPNN